jgi:diacylglycerol kinase (ATP)
LQRILRATLNTLNGLRAAAASEAAFRQELFLFALSVPLAIVIATDNWTRLFLIMMVVAIMVVELLNTAIEKLADRVTLEHDPLIGRVKDMGSAAVGITLLMAGAVWLFAIWQRIAALLS